MTELNEKLAYSFGGIFFLLLIASLLILVLKKIRPEGNWLELQQRITSWWIIITLFSSYLFRFMCFYFFLSGWCWSARQKDFFILPPSCTGG